MVSKSLSVYIMFEKIHVIIKVLWYIQLYMNPYKSRKTFLLFPVADGIMLTFDYVEGFMKNFDKIPSFVVRLS